MSEFALRLMVLLAPGAIALLILDALVSHKQWRLHTQVVYAALLGVASYLGFQAANNFWHGLDPEASTIRFWSALLQPNNPIDISEVGMTCLFSIVTGFAVATAVNRKWLPRVAHWI